MIKGVPRRLQFPFVFHSANRAVVLAAQQTRKYLRVIENLIIRSNNCNMWPWRWSIAVCVTLVLLLPMPSSDAQELSAKDVPATPSSSASSPSRENSDSARSAARAAGSLVAHSDVYIARNQRECFETRNLVSCIKYKASKLIWKLATNGMGFFPNEYERELEKPRWLRLVQLGEPSDEVMVFNDAKSLEGGFN